MIQNTSAMASGLYRSVEPPVTSGLEPAFGEHLPFSGITSHLLGEFCEFGARNLSANLLIRDDSDGPIFERNPSEIFAKISEAYNSIKQSGISEIELAELGIPSPHSIREPVCGSSANFMMKLFLDDDLGIPSPHSIREPVCGSSANFMMKLFLDDDFGNPIAPFNSRACLRVVGKFYDEIVS
ncbi:hypothetical protein [Burkholderia ubonensis]|uniref:hypothetical protein n=1 Tax=Burkholderia ubonensis TaxID=101571 RepID=UPI0015A6D042|nr:hypothetical protein [Burkholderia ubonensis]